MEFGFSGEQDELRRTVRSFLEQKSTESDVRRLMETDEGYDPAVWLQMGDQMGIQGLAVPEEFGGSGYTFRELAIVLEEMGRSLACAPFLSSAVLAPSLLLALEDEAAKKELLPGVASGETIATVAFVEDNGTWDTEGLALTARRDGDHYRLDGSKSFVLDGAIAALVLVAACTDAGVGIFAVDGNAEGLTRTTLSTMDQTRKLARLEMVDTPGRLIGTEGQGRHALESALCLAVVALAHEQIGGAQRCLEMAVQYAKDRIQFGRPVGSFQAVKHKCADMFVHVELARSAAYYAASCAAEGDADLLVAAAMAKSYCSQAYSFAAAENIQVHGGIGFTWEHPAHLYLKRAKSSELLLGDPRHHRKILARHIGI